METIRIDGREFHGITEALTASQDDFILAQLRRSGAMDVLAGLPKDATADQRSAASDEMFNRIVESGRKYKLLAGLLTEEGQKWTQAGAEENARRFAELTATEDKVTMGGAVMRHVVLFFQFGAASSTTSATSSSQSDAAPPSENVAAETSAISAQ